MIGGSKHEARRAQDFKGVFRRLLSSRTALVATLAFAPASFAGVAYAAFTATTTNSGSSISAAASFGRCLVDEITADNPVGYWRMNESAGTTLFDSAGSNNGTYQNGPTLGQPGPLGDPTDRAVTFDGLDDQAVVPHSSAYDVGDTFTYEAWIKKAAHGTWQAIVSKGFGGFWLGFGPGNDILLYELTSGQRVAHTYGNSSITDSKWHQVVVTKNGSTTKIYVDGVDRTVLDTNMTFTNNTGSIMIGRKADGFQPWSGALGEVAIYNTALSAGRIRAHYNSARCYRDEVRADSPTAVWRLGEPTGASTAFDSIGSSFGAYGNGPTLGAASLLDTGAANSAVSFDGVDDRIDVPDTASLRLAGDMSIEAWIKPTSLATGWTRVIGKGAATTRNYGLWVNANGQAQFDQCTSGCAAYMDATSPTGTIAPGKTYHLVGTVSGATMTLYVNGIPVGTATRTGAATTSSAQLVIGRSDESGFSNDFNGTIDDAAIYSGALSKARVQDHYYTGRSYTDVILGAAPVAYWRLGETSGTTAVDQTGTNNGTYNSGYTLGTPGAVAGDSDAAVTLNGSTGYVRAPDSASLDVGDVFTFEAWIKRNSLTKAVAIMTKQANMPTLSISLAGAVGLSKSAVGSVSTSTTAITENTNWHYIAVTKNGGSVHIYIDGVDRTGTVTNRTMANNASPLDLGRENGSSVEFDGPIDEAAVYNRAITADEAALHYAAGIKQPR